MPPRILIVDDHASNVRIIEEILGNDYDLATAHDGEGALEIAPVWRPDIVLLDIMLPGVDGYGVADRLRRLPACGHTKIVMVSAMNRVGDRLHAYECGADDFVTKPFDEDELCSKVRAHLRLKRAQDANRLESDMLSVIAAGAGRPIDGILAPLRRLRDEPTASRVDRLHLARAARDELDRLLSFFERLHILSAMRSGEWTPGASAHAASSLIERVNGARVEAAAAKGVALRSSGDATGHVTIGAESFDWIVGTLLDNAIEASPTGATVDVRLESTGQEVTITVRDEGPGIPPALRTSILDESALPSPPGSSPGLGLRLARETAHQHGGSLTLDPTDVGTSFTVRLPRCDAERSARPSTLGACPSTPLRGPRTGS